MAVSTEEFVNPKSMMTPGFAAAAVATVAGALFSNFAIALPASLMILSFLFGAIVFHSKEFADPSMKYVAKAFFYIINSLIIFAMASGTHSVLDPSKRTTRSNAGFAIVGSAYAQATASSTPTITQERPFFYDWTKATSTLDKPPADAGVIKVTTKKDFGSIKDFFVKARLATPDYKVHIELDKSNLPGEVKSVTWYLPQEYFSKKSLTATDEAKNFAFNVEAWRPFSLSAKIELKSGEILHTGKVVSFAENRE